MAEYEERSLDDLTEEPSQHRLDELKEKGQTAQSRELTSAIVFITVLICVYFFSAKFFTNYSDLLKEIFTKDLLKKFDTSDWNTFSEIMSRCMKLAVMTFAPIGIAALVLGILGSVAQTGFIFTTETLTPDFNRVNPVNGFMKILSLKSLTEGTKSLFKLVAVLMVVYSFLKKEMAMLPDLVAMNVTQILHYMATVSVKVLAVVSVVLLVAAGFDYFIQWRRFRQQARMTKSEAKQELKEREGDPQIKARIRSIQREAARKRMMKAIPKADVIVTNPTHFAVAIVYNPEEHFAPKVVAKGADFLAQKIKAVAKENNIPMVENVALARTLYKHVKVGQLVPRSLYQAVAEVLAYVYKLRGKKPKLQDEKGTNTKEGVSPNL